MASLTDLFEEEGRSKTEREKSLIALQKASLPCGSDLDDHPSMELYNQGALQIIIHIYVSSPGTYFIMA